LPPKSEAIFVYKTLSLQDATSAFIKTKRYNALIPAADRFIDITDTFLQSVTIRRREGNRLMAEIRLKENESLDSALRRFKRSCARSGVLAELRKREHYEKPSVKRKKKSEAARKRKYK